MMIIFLDKDDVLLTEYLPRGTTINDPSDASIIEQLSSVIVEKGRRKVSQGVLLLHDNASIDKCNIVQVAIRQAILVELNHSVDSPDIAPIESHLFSNLKEFLRGRSFSSDDGAITTVEDYLTDLNSEFFCKAVQNLHDRWGHVVASEGQYIQYMR